MFDPPTRPPGEIYLDGNSLGLPTAAARVALRTAVEAWSQFAIRGWTTGPAPWFDMPRQASRLLAPLLGADADDIAVGGSTTAVLHQILATWYDPTGALLIDATAFPTDRYAVDSHVRLRGGLGVAVIPPDDDGLIVEEDLFVDCVTIRFAVLPAVVFTTGQLLDMASVTRAARDNGIVVAWDCSHSAGAIDHRFRADDIDLAFGCGYKYLGGGPGAVAWLYAHPRMRDRRPGLAGWFGGDPATMFDMRPEFAPAADAGRYLQGTPHVFSLAPLIGSLGALNEIGMPALRAKSLALTTHLRGRSEALGLKIATPREDARRGGHLAVRHPAAGALSRALRARGVVPDFRPPDILRLCPAPLSSSETDCDAAADILADVLRTREYERFEGRDAVT